MIDLYIQDFGSQTKLFIIASTPREAEQQYYSLYNREATSGELYPIGESENKHKYYIWTSKKKLKQYYMNYFENLYFLKTGNEPSGDLFRNKLAEIAEKRINSIKRQDITARKQKFSFGSFDYFCKRKYNTFD